MYILLRILVLTILMQLQLQVGLCSDGQQDTPSEKPEFILLLDPPESVQDQNFEIIQATYDEPLPLPVDPDSAEISGSKIDPRIGDLDKSMSQIRLFEELDSKDNPKNIAAQIMNLTPIHIESGDWIFRRPNRYPVRFCHLPLYYEEINLERCGRGYGCCQPLMSSVHFLGTTVCLPVEMIFDPPCELVQSRGDCLTCQEFKDSHH